MKIVDVLKKLESQKQYFLDNGMVNEAATVEEAKTHLSKYIHTEVVSKKEVAKEWEGGGGNISEFIEKIITLLSQVSALPKDEIEQTYNVQNLKTIYYLIHNSNLEMNRIIDGMKSSQIGQLTRFGKKGNVLKGELGQNMDLYTELKAMLLYENGDWVKPLAEFYDNFEERSIKLDALAGDVKRIDNLFSVFESTGLPMECIKRIAATTGSQTPNRGRFETLFALLCKGGKFKVTAKTSGYDDKESGDIIIGNKGIELKVNAGSGGGRIGGQKGYNSVEAIKKAYKTAMVSFAKNVNKVYGSQIPKDNAELTGKFAEILAPYMAGKYELSLDLTKDARGEGVKTIDEAIADICSAAIAVIGTPDAKTALNLKKEALILYKSIWCNSTVVDKVNNNIAKLIDAYAADRSVTDFVQERRVLSEGDYIGFTQQVCAKLFAYYAELEPFDYIFIINTDKDLEGAKMLVLSNNAVKRLGNASPEEIASSGLYFKELGQMYGSPARKVRPSIDINF